MKCGGRHGGATRRRAGWGSIFSLPALLLATAAFAADGPLEALVPPTSGKGLCYARAYSADHLKEHVGQETLAALFSWRYDPSTAVQASRIQLQLRGSRIVTILGSCSWNEHANIDTSGKRMLATFKGTAAYDCLVVSAPGSAEEAGYFIVEPRDRGKTVLLHLDTPIGTVATKTRPGGEGSLDLGVEDRVFRLDRTGAADCGALDASVEAP